MKARISEYDKLMLQQSAITTPHCCICGLKRDAGHHEPPRGRVGKHKVTYSVDGFGNGELCHGHLHGTQGWVAILPGGSAIADSEASVHVNARRAQAGRSPVVAGEEFELW